MVDNLENNIHTLMAAYEQQKARADKLERELDHSRKNNKNADEKVKQLEDKVNSLCMKSAFTSPTSDNSEVKNRIDELIRQVDEAIALLQ